LAKAGAASPIRYAFSTLPKRSPSASMPPALAMPPTIQRKRGRVLMAWRAASALVALLSLTKRTRPTVATASMRWARPGKLMSPSAASWIDTPRARAAA
jgi:hypothetical protein